ncbi:MAG TPA: DcaP family trimeric outer membrane transporter [Candidatus Angelobacter sp.]
MGRTSVWIVLVLCAGGVSAFAQNHDASQTQQTQDVQQLQEKVQQLEQLTQELKARLAELEKAQSGTPQVVNATATTGGQPTSSTAGQPPASTPPKDTSPLAAAVPVANPQDAPPQPAPPEEKVSKPEMEVYGHAMLDLGYDFGQINPNWFDVERPTQLPAFKNEFGQNGTLFTGVRQTRFGVKNLFPTKFGQLKTVFEFELFGVGIDAGQTTFRLRQAYGEIGQLLAGQTWSPFMDPDVFPNSIEYWGPNGMVFFRNVQLRWQPINNGNKQVMIALERPGASADLGTVQDRDILQGVQFRFPAPDISGHVRYGGKRTYIQLAGMFRYISWDDNAPTAITNLTGHTYGWGAHVSSNVGVGEKDTIKWSVIYGNGVENYMNDAPVDIGPKARLFDLHRPLTGEPLPVLGVVAFYDHYWNEKFSSTFGSSLVNITNTPLLLPSTFRRGWYGIADLLYYPVKNVMLGGEFIWGRRDNFTDGFTFDDYRLQFSFKYNFSFKLLGGTK